MQLVFISKMPRQFLFITEFLKPIYDLFLNMAHHATFRLSAYILFKSYGPFYTVFIS